MKKKPNLNDELRKANEKNRDNKAAIKKLKGSYEAHEKIIKVKEEYVRELIKIHDECIGSMRKTQSEKLVLLNSYREENDKLQDALKNRDCRIVELEKAIAHLAIQLSIL